MFKSRRTAYLGVLIATGILLAGMLSGCGKKKQATIRTVDVQGRYCYESLIDSVEKRYEKLIRSLSEAIPDYRKTFMDQDQELILFSLDNKNYLASFDLTDESKDAYHELNVPGLIHASGKIRSGKFFLISSMLDAQYDLDYSLTILDKNGEIEGEMHSLPELRNKLFESACVTEKDEVVFCDGETLYFIDNSFSVSRKVSPKCGRIRSAAVNDKGQIALAADASDESGSNMYTQSFLVYDENGKELHSEWIPSLSGSQTVIFGAEAALNEDFFAVNDVFSGRFSTISKSWSEMDVKMVRSTSMSSSETHTEAYGTKISWIDEMEALGNGAYRFSGGMSILGCAKTGVFNVQYRKEETSREKITMGIIEPLEWSYMESVADYFNMVQSKYTIDVVNYFDQSQDDRYSEYQHATAQFLKDAAEGKAPELLYISPSLCNRLIAENCLMDMKKNLITEEMTSGAYENILQLMMTHDSQYYYSPNFSLYVVAADSKTAGESEEAKMSDLVRIAKGSDSVISGDITDMFYPGIYELIVEKRDKTETVAGMEACVKDAYLIDKEGVFLSNERQYAMLRCEKLNSFSDYAGLSHLFENKMTTLNFPNMSSVSAVGFDNVFAVSTSCKNTEAARAFLQMLSSDIVQSSIGQLGGGIPINREACNRDVESNRDLLENMPPRSLVSDQETTPVFMVKDPDSYVDLYFKLIDNNTLAFHNDEQIVTIIAEEYDALMSGSQDEHTTAENIYSRCRLYCDEIGM
ncbi:MAG: hypothetical protein J5752_02485 [Clostridiales bacterium]|nr:hypothetical protein [Clostridiales bacterium]